MYNDSVLFRLSVDVYNRSKILFESLQDLVESSDYKFKKFTFFNSSDICFSKAQLRKNSILLSIYLQHILIHQITSRVLEITKFAIYNYLLDKYPLSTTGRRYEKLNTILNYEMGRFDDIKNKRAPLHVGMSFMPVDGSVADDDFYRYTIWLIENSLCDPSPFFDAFFVLKVSSCLSNWYIATIKSINRDEYSI